MLAKHEMQWLLPWKILIEDNRIQTPHWTYVLYQDPYQVEKMGLILNSNPK